MLSINDIKVGTIFKYQNAPYEFLRVNHLKLGRGKALLQTKIKNLITGQVLEKNFRPADSFEEVSIVRKKANYLYHEGQKRYFFMDQDDYDQFFLERDVLGEKANFLKESLQVNILYFDEQVIGIELPPKVDLKVKEAPGGVRGDTAGSATKTVVLETGYKLNAPLFVKEGDMVKVNTETGEYVERV